MIDYIYKVDPYNDHRFETFVYVIQTSLSCRMYVHVFICHVVIPDDVLQTAQYCIKRFILNTCFQVYDLGNFITF